jgi:hypothetical protein
LGETFIAWEYCPTGTAVPLGAIFSLTKSYLRSASLKFFSSTVLSAEALSFPRHRFLPATRAQRQLNILRQAEMQI